MRGHYKLFLVLRSPTPDTQGQATEEKEIVLHCTKKRQSTGAEVVSGSIAESTDSLILETRIRRDLIGARGAIKSASLDGKSVKVESIIESLPPSPPRRFMTIRVSYHG